ncbi:MAG: EF-hand domain-containing protein, partial [Rhodocyclaceae bacterium]|nr:EF-hand domain-containing protein [Rhodocyclaceae bacterium]
RQAAQAQITAALATARAGGGLPVNGQLDSALRTVSQSSDELFGSFAEYAFDFYRTANDIAALSDITGAQLTGEELTNSLLKTQADALKAGFDSEVRRLDALVDAAQAQADAATKSTVALQSMTDAIARFTDSLGATLSNSLATAFDMYDTDSSNAIGWGEFSAAFGTLASEATLKALFDKTDLNGNGTISQLEAINANTANLLANMRVTGAGGNLAGAATYTGTQVVAEASKLLTGGATTASVIDTASTGYGVSSGSLAAVAATLPKDPVAQAFIDYQNRVAAHAALSAQERSDVMAEAGRRAGASGESVEKELYKWALSLGWNAGMVDKAMGWSNGTSNAWATANGYPAFAQGINYLPHDTMALLHEGEAVVPKVYNPYNPNATAVGNGRLESLVQALTAEVQRLQIIVNDGNRHQQRTADAVNGNPEAPMLVETV